MLFAIFFSDHYRKHQNHLLLATSAMFCIVLLLPPSYQRPLIVHVVSECSSRRCSKTRAALKVGTHRGSIYTTIRGLGPKIPYYRRNYGSQFPNSCICGPSGAHCFVVEGLGFWWMEATLYGLGVQDPNHTAVPSFYVAAACGWFRGVMLILLVLSRVWRNGCL